jgi:hypothetical protein
MDSFLINEDTLKLQSLEDAISYPAYKEVGGTEPLEIDTFDYSLISDHVKSNEKIINFEGAQIDLLLEVVNLLHNNKKKFNIDKHSYVGFYWRGLPILVVKTRSEEQPTRMMYVSVKVYKDLLAERLTDKKINRAIVGTFGGLLVLGGLFAGYLFINKNNS